LSAGVRRFFSYGLSAETIESYFGDGREMGARIAYGRQVCGRHGKAPELGKDLWAYRRHVTYAASCEARDLSTDDSRFQEDYFSDVITVTQ